MTKLADLPADILRLILRYKSVSYMPVTLWKCGDLRLQRTMANGGVEMVELKCHGRMSTSRYPKMLRCLRQLRVLKIQTHYNRVMEPEDLAVELQHLSRTLEVLCLTCPEAELAFLAPAPSIATFFDDPFSPATRCGFWNTDSEIWNVAETFPRLKTLKLVGHSKALNCKAFSSLPPSVTKLRAHLPRVGFAADCGSLPRSLLDLYLTPRPETFSRLACADLVDLPPNLTSLRSYGRLDNFMEAAHLIPQTITKLPHFECALDESSEPVFPPGLSRVKIITHAPISGNTIWLRLLPTFLVDLCLHCPPLDANALRLIPRTLRRLRIKSISWEGVTEDCFPPIDHLDLADYSNIGPSEAKRLPSTLTGLGHSSFNRSFAASCEALPFFPASLREMRLYVRPEAQRQQPAIPAIAAIPRGQQLPTSLTTLALISTKWTGTAEDIRNFLPRNLTTLTTFFEKIDASIVAALPPALTTLYLHDAVQLGTDAFACLPRTLKRISIPTLKIVLDDSKVDHISRQNLLETALEGLPETLESLIVEAVMASVMWTSESGQEKEVPAPASGYQKPVYHEDPLPALAYTRLPRSLTGLRWGTLTPLALEHLPKGLRELTCSILVLEDAHLKLLPRRLRSLHISSLQFNVTTEVALKHLPPDVEGRIFASLDGQLSKSTISVLGDLRAIYQRSRNEPLRFPDPRIKEECRRHSQNEANGATANSKGM